MAEYALKHINYFSPNSLKYYSYFTLTILFPFPPAGDVLLTSAYLSYVGCFNRQYRVQLLEDKWRPFMKTLNVSNSVW